MLKFGVPQITLEGSRDQNLRGGGGTPCKVGLTLMSSNLLENVERFDSLTFLFTWNEKNFLNFQCFNSLSFWLKQELKFN